ncbi:uncharacterized protein VTP21DRAFT_1530 [Calcarisporiella thermophila]|uniref:uncharacterized protein n=1 Tax=Calcarisporiella thermophila TaxID=911321 RepID=UPI00374249D7
MGEVRVEGKKNTDNLRRILREIHNGCTGNCFAGDVEHCEQKVTEEDKSRLEQLKEKVAIYTSHQRFVEAWKPKYFFFPSGESNTMPKKEHCCVEKKPSLVLEFSGILLEYRLPRFNKALVGSIYSNFLLQLLESAFILFSNFSFTELYISRETVSRATIMDFSLYSAQIIEVLLAFDAHLTYIRFLTRFLKIFRN